jgi:hypothetical protein
MRTALVWGAGVGVLQALSPLAFPWLGATTVYAFGLAFIAAIYIGFAVADGRPQVLAAETAVAAVFVVVAAVAIAVSPWLLVAGLAGHGVKDAVQHRTGFVNGTRWWPPFCAAVDWLVAVVLAIELIAGAGFHH